MINAEYRILNSELMNCPSTCHVSMQRSKCVCLGPSSADGKMNMLFCFTMIQCIYVQYCFKYIVICNIVNVLQICRIACSNKQFATRLIEYLFAFHLKYLKQHTIYKSQYYNIIIFNRLWMVPYIPISNQFLLCLYPIYTQLIN